MLSLSRLRSARTFNLLFRGLVLALFATAVSRAQESGAISGRVINQDTGFPVPGATLTVAELGMSATSDLGGAFTIREVPAGPRDVIVVRDEFQPATITGINVTGGGVSQIDIPVAPVGSNIVVMEAYSVSADIVQSSGIGLLAARQKASTVSDAISSDQFARLAVGDAAEALSKVTGASVVDGKYVLIRGLGDRYSNTLMNGVSVPSADPDKRAVQMDQFPADLIESIVTTKSFTPDQPGAFSGGSVNLKTKAFPEQLFVSVSGSVEYNTNTTGEDILVVQGGGGEAPDLPASLPNRTAATLAARQGDFGLAESLDQATKAFHPAGFFPTTRKADPDFGASVAFGNRLYFGDEGLFGFTASVTYDRSYSHYSDGESNRFLGTSAEPINRLLLTSDTSLLSVDPTAIGVPAGTPAFGVTSSSVEEATGAFVKLAVRPVGEHEVTLDLFYNESSNDTVRRGVGEEAINYGGSIFEVYDLLLTERSISSAQLAGKSLFPALNELQIDWRASLSSSTQDQPDYRTLAAVYDFNGNFVNATSVQPNRYFRELEEDATEGGIDVTLPFAHRDREHRLKIGGMASHNERTYGEQRFQYAVNPQDREDLEAFPGPVGIVGRTANSVSFGNTITRLQEPNNYEGEQDITGVYSMIDYQITDRWRGITGVRFESTEINTVPAEVPGLTPRPGAIDESDTLPALSLVFAQSERINWRFAYGRTIARPTYKELSDISYEDVFTGDVYLGNPDLKLTVIDNLDLRWEWFPRKGETIAVSAFYKKLDQPIEVLYNPALGSIQPQNVEEGIIYGLELEFRRGLDFISDGLGDFSVGGNLSLIHSEVTIPPVELAILRANDPGAEDKRDLLGQSPYVLNLDVSYDRTDWGTTATLSYNVVGPRLDLVNFGPLPDVYEQPAGLLNLVISQRLSSRWKLKFSAKNLLDPDKEKTIGTEIGDLVFSRYSTGRSFSLSLSYLFE